MIKETVSKFSFALSYILNFYILARSHGIQALLNEFQTISVFLIRVTIEDILTIAIVLQLYCDSMVHMDIAILLR